MTLLYFYMFFFSKYSQQRKRKNSEAINRELQAKDGIHNNLLSICGVRLSPFELDHLLMALSQLDNAHCEGLRYIQMNSINRKKSFQRMETYLNQIGDEHPMKKVKHELINLINPTDSMHDSKH